MEEIWKTVPFAPFYEASTHGRIRSIERYREVVIFGKSHSRKIRPRVLSPGLMSRGYHVVDLVIGNAVARTFSVHRVVAITFLGEHPDKHQVNHKNGVRTDNRLENLEWMTPSENIAHGFSSNGRKPTLKGVTGGDHPASRPIIGASVHDGSVIKFDSTADAGRAGYCAASIYACLSGKRKTHKRMTWHRA